MLRNRLANCRAAAWLVLATVAMIQAAPLAAEQVTGLEAWHSSGQTFLVWQEVDPPTKDETVSCQELGRLRGEMDKTKKIRYRIYRSTEPIKSVEGLELLAEAKPLTCWNAGPGFGKDALRYVVKDGEKPVAPGTGIYVHTPKEEGKAYYAVIASISGTENKALGAGNLTAAAIDEKTGPGAPVLQRIEKKKDWHYVNGESTLHFYVRWEAPPNCSVESMPFDYVVAVPPKELKPRYVGLHLHCWGGNLMGGYAWWSDAEKGALLVASNQVPYDWWTGYHEKYWEGRSSHRKDVWQKGVVRPYSTTRMLSFLDWVTTKWEVDLTKTFVAGSSMGGSGSLMFAIRYPERIAYCRSWVGVHIPAKSPTFKGSYAGVYGEPDWGVKFEDGTPVWDYYDDTWYLRRYPAKEIGFLAFSNGKNDGGIGWPQAYEFYKALQETKRPHLFVWGLAGHGQRASLPKDGGQRVMPIEMRTDLSLPAFTGCSLDDNPGTATAKTAEQLEKEKKEIEEWNKANRQKKSLDPFDGDPTGQVNLYPYWETADIVDTEEKWEMTVGLIDKAPKPDCTVDVTPRRRQKFKPEPGTTLNWTSTPTGGGEVQAGTTKVDENGIFTLDKVKVGKGKNRLVVTK